jgi:S1-C subfamily serine protease
LAKNQYEQLKATGKVARGWLGVEPGRLNEALAEKLGVKGTDGAVINHVVPHGPAAAAGIEPGDVVVQWNGKPIHDPAELVLAVGQSAIGSKASATILRKGNRVKITVTVADRPSQFH